MNKKYIVILFLVSLFHNNNAMQSTCIKSIVVWPPIIGAYKPVDCPTYITRNIRFKGTANLVGGSQTPKVTHLKINGKKIELTNKQQPNIDFFSRNPVFERLINYNKENEIESFKLFYLNKKANKTIICTWNSSDKIPTFGIHNDVTEGNPRLCFKDTQGNFHTIIEEKFQIPILNLFFGNAATCLIKYYDIQLTKQGTLPKYWHKWRIVTKTLNGAFTLFIIYIVCYKIAENYL